MALTPLALDGALERMAASIDRARQSLYYCDVDFARKTRRDMHNDVHAGIYVYVAAGLERYVADSLHAVVDEINGEQLKWKQLRYSILAIACGGDFDALQQVRGLKMWDRRAELLTRNQSSDTCTVSAAHLPVDGGTVRPDHLDTFWKVLGLEGDPAPGPIHRLALADLADSRNAVAHGEKTPLEVAGHKSVMDTLRLLERIEEIVLHVHYGLVDYLRKQGYKR